MINNLAHRFFMLVSFGAILVSVSEFWFYEVSEDVNSILILLLYGVLGYLFLIIMQRYGVQTFSGFFVCASLLGFLIEGVPVPVVYSGLPLSIVWTSLAWHALLSVCVGWFLFRQVMTKCSWLKALVFNVVVGSCLGLWNAYMWNAKEESSHGEVVFQWQPIDLFIEQFLLGYVLFVVGHIVFERSYKPNLQFNTIEYLGIWALIGLFAMLTAMASGVLLFSSVLPVLVVMCMWALFINAKKSNKTEPLFINQLMDPRIRLWRYGLTAIIPICAISVYVLVVSKQIGLEMNVFVIFTAAPISVWFFLRSIIQNLK